VLVVLVGLLQFLPLVAVRVVDAIFLHHGLSAEMVNGFSETIL
jgi:hypothetical protein